jgi:hypothetical protein
LRFSSILTPVYRSRPDRYWCTRVPSGTRNQRLSDFRVRGRTRAKNHAAIRLLGLRVSRWRGINPTGRPRETPSSASGRLDPFRVASIEVPKSDP